MSTIDLGATLTIAVDPHPLFVATGLLVRAGERYQFHASGKWCDWHTVTDANGWNMPLLHYLNRVPGAAFFCLCACIDHDEDHAFAIGGDAVWTVPAGTAADAKLSLFANDMRCMYFNNRSLPEAEGGPLKVEIRRLA